MKLLTATEDLRYRILNSYPPEGFKIPAGKSIRITNEVLPLMRFRKEKGKGHAQYSVSELSAGCAGIVASG